MSTLDSRERFQQRTDTMTIGVRRHDMLIGAVDHALPLPRVPEGINDTVGIEKILRNRQVVLTGAKDVVIATGEHDLQGLRADGVEMARRDAFRIDRRLRKMGKEARVNLGEINRLGA